MSLDLTIKTNKLIRHVSTGVYIREDGTECYLFTFKILENKKYHIPNRVFQFHQPINYLKRGKRECITKVINTLKK